MKRKGELFIAAILILIFSCNTTETPDNISYSTPFTGGYYDRGPLPEKTAYLTFDDGPCDWTEGILDILKKEEVKATFFVSAYWNMRERRGNLKFRKYSGTLIRMQREGHIIGNHTADHKNLNRLTDDEIREQFSRNQELLNDAMGNEAPVMYILRPPLGCPWCRNTPRETKVRIGKILAETGIVALWTNEYDSSDSWNWVSGEWYRRSSRVDETDPEFLAKMHRIYERIAARADGGGIVVLLHDTHNTTCRILPALIQGLKVKGYRFATMEDYVIWKYGMSSSELLRRK